MEEKKRVLTAFRLLFWTGVLGIPVAILGMAVKGTWPSLVLSLITLVGIFWLWREIRSKKLLICAVAGVISLVLSVVTLAAPDSVKQALEIAAAVANLVNLYCLFRGTADYMVEQGYPETAADGKLAANLAIVLYVVTAAAGVLSYITLASDSLSYIMITLGMVVMLAGLAVGVMGIILVITRITFFDRCYKRLGSGKPERVPPRSDAKDAEE